MRKKPPAGAMRNRSIATAAALVFLQGCSESAPPPGETIAAPSREAADVTMQGRDSSSDNKLMGSLNAAGIPTTYTAQFENGQLAKISEQRSAGQAAEYRFYGARMTHYRGAPLAGGANIDIEFDLQGAVAAAKRGDGTAAEIPTEEIAALVSRAHLLRSHAMTQRSVKSH